jgi:hypothetical protein
MPGNIVSSVIPILRSVQSAWLRQAEGSFDPLNQLVWLPERGDLDSFGEIFCERVRFRLLRPLALVSEVIDQEVWLGRHQEGPPAERSCARPH